MTAKSNSIKIRKPYEQTERHTVNFSQSTMAKQSFKDECNINTIMSKYQKTGLISHVQEVVGSYGDFTSVQDYQLSLNQVIEAQEAFEHLPSSIRKRFANDPAHLMSFLDDASNYDEAVRLGLIEPKAPPEEPEKKSWGGAPQTPPATPPSGEAPA